MQGKWAHLFFRKDKLKIGRNWCKLGKIGWNWLKLKLSIFAICTNFRQFLQFVSIFANFFGGLIGHYLLNRNFSNFLKMLHFGKIPKNFDQNLARFSKKFSKILANFAKICFKKSAKISAIFNEKIEIRERFLGFDSKTLQRSFWGPRGFFSAVLSISTPNGAKEW